MATPSVPLGLFSMGRRGTGAFVSVSTSLSCCRRSVSGDSLDLPVVPLGEIVCLGDEELDDGEEVPGDEELAPPCGGCCWAVGLPLARPRPTGSGAGSNCPGRAETGGVGSGSSPLAPGRGGCPEPSPCDTPRPLPRPAIDHVGFGLKWKTKKGEEERSIMCGIENESRRESS